MSRCAGCKKILDHQVLSALGQQWHPQCFRCMACKKPITERFHTHQGKAFHENCAQMQFGKRCHACGGPLKEQGLTALGRDWHPACFRCAACGLVIAERSFQSKDQEPYHLSCFQQRFSRRCDVCGEPLIKKHVVDGWGNAYCRKHVKKLPRCISCGRLICQTITQGGLRWQDGHHLCHLCSPEAVTSQAQAQILFEEMLIAFGELGFSFSGIKLPFRLVSREELDQWSTKRHSSRPLLGMARHQQIRQGRKMVSRRFIEILILRGLSTAHFRSVAVHELCHAWLFYRKCHDLPEKVEEGLCVLCEYLWLELQSSQEADVRRQTLIADPDPIYGDGLRAALKACKKRGLADLFSYVQKKRSFPGGLLGWLGGVGS